MESPEKIADLKMQLGNVKQKLLEEFLDTLEII